MRSILCFLAIILISPVRSLAQRIDFGSVGEIETLNPLYVEGRRAEEIIEVLFGRLFILDKNFEWESDIAAVPPQECIRTFPEGRLTVEISLHKEIRWHNYQGAPGEAFSAEDVCATFEKIRETLNSPLYDLVYPIESIVALGNDRVRITYRRDMGYRRAFAWVRPLSFPILPKRFIDDPHFDREFGRSHIATWSIGPFALEDPVTAVIRLTRTHEYFRGRLENIGQFVRHTMGTQQGVVECLNAGSCNLGMNLHWRWLDPLPEEQFGHIDFPSATLTAICFNLWGNRDSYRLLRTKAFRKALTLCFDKRSIVQQVYSQAPDPVLLTGPFLKRHVYDYSVLDFEYDPSRARAIIDSLVDADPEIRRPIRLEFLYEGSDIMMASEEDQMHHMYQEILRKVGIELVRTRLDPPSFRRRVRDREFDLVLYSWESPGSPDLLMWDEPVQGRYSPNISGYGSQDDGARPEEGFYRNLRRAEMEHNRSYYYAVHRHLREDYAALFLWNLRRFHVASNALIIPREQNVVRLMRTIREWRFQY